MPIPNNQTRRTSPATVRVAAAIIVVLALFAFGLWWTGPRKQDQAANAEKAIVGAPISPTALGTKCKFTEGDRAGEVADFSPRPPLPVGSPCNDGTSSSGVVVE